MGRISEKIQALKDNERRRMAEQAVAKKAVLRLRDQIAKDIANKLHSDAPARRLRIRTHVFKDGIGEVQGAINILDPGGWFGDDKCVTQILMGSSDFKTIQVYSHFHHGDQAFGTVSVEHAESDKASVMQKVEDFIVERVVNYLRQSKG